MHNNPKNVYEERMAQENWALISANKQNSILDIVTSSGINDIFYVFLNNDLLHNKQAVNMVIKAWNKAGNQKEHLNNKLSVPSICITMNYMYRVTTEQDNFILKIWNMVEGNKKTEVLNELNEVIVQRILRCSYSSQSTISKKQANNEIVKIWKMLNSDSIKLFLNSNEINKIFIHNLFICLHNNGTNKEDSVTLIKKAWEMIDCKKDFLSELRATEIYQMFDFVYMPNTSDDITEEILYSITKIKSNFLNNLSVKQIYNLLLFLNDSSSNQSYTLARTTSQSSDIMVRTTSQSSDTMVSTTSQSNENKKEEIALVGSRSRKDLIKYIWEAGVTNKENILEKLNANDIYKLFSFFQNPQDKNNSDTIIKEIWEMMSQNKQAEFSNKFGVDNISSLLRILESNEMQSGFDVNESKFSVDKANIHNFSKNKSISAISAISAQSNENENQSSHENEDQSRHENEDRGGHENEGQSRHENEDRGSHENEDQSRHENEDQGGHNSSFNSDVLNDAFEDLDDTYTGEHLHNTGGTDGHNISNDF